MTDEERKRLADLQSENGRLRALMKRQPPFSGSTFGHGKVRRVVPAKKAPENWRTDKTAAGILAKIQKENP